MDMGVQGVPMDHPNTLGFEFYENHVPARIGPAQLFSDPKHVLEPFFPADEML